AAAFAGAGFVKLTQPKEKLATAMAWTTDFSAGGLKTIGALEILAALGLILPGALGIAPIVVALAALGLVLLMVGAIVVHVRRNEIQMVGGNILLLILAAIVAWGRFGPYAF